MAQLSVKKLALIALAFAVVTAGLVWNFVSTKTTIAKTEGVPVIVAKQDIPPRTKITLDMVEQVLVPEAGAPQTGRVTELNTVDGVLTREAIGAGEHITERRLYLEGKTSTGFSGMIPKDKRAVTVFATESTGVANFIKAGDFVDVYVTFDGKDVGQAATSVVLQNQLVLAVNKDTDETGKDHKDKEAPKRFTVTLAVTPEEASRLVLADEKGKIRLALRPYLPEENTIPTTVSPRDLVEARQQVLGSGAVTVQGPTTNVESAPVHEAPSAPTGVMIMRGTKMSIAPVS